MIDIVLAALGLIFGLFFGFMSLRLYRKSKKKLSYQFEHINLIQKNKRDIPNGVEILFKGKKVDILSKTSVIIWNDGGQTINGEDIVKTDPLRIMIDKEMEIISVNVSKVTREVNDFRVDNSNIDTKNEVLCTFNYLDPKDGAIIDIYYNGEYVKPKVTGTIKGLRRIINIGEVYVPESYSEKLIKFMQRWVVPIMGVLFGSLLIFLSALYFHVFSVERIKPSIIEDSDVSGTYVFFLVIGITLVVLSILVFIINRIGRVKCPKELIK